MASLPAALQQHLAGKVDLSVSSSSGGIEARRRVFEDPRFLPFRSIQSTSSAAPRRQANPLYDMHEVKFPSEGKFPSGIMFPNEDKFPTGNKFPSHPVKGNPAAAFASTMLSQDSTISSNNNNNNNNNTTMPSKMLLNEYSESFAQMKLNTESGNQLNIKAAEPTNAIASKQSSWTSFE